jgi:serine/threonine protein kinase
MEPMSEQTIFLAALDKDPTERAAFLDEACAGDAELKRSVESLLRLHTEAHGFLDVPALEQLAAAASRQEDVAANLSFLAPSSEPGSLGRLDHYEILEVIGRGGMGIVLRARDTKLERVVALKVLAAPLAASGTARQRFAREACAAAAVRDDHVIDIHAVCVDGPVPYLVMEFIDGCNLEALIRRDGPLEIKQILRIGLQIASGLAAAHKQGLIHRDVKPANILLENGVQRVKLTDFGLARAADDATLTQTGFIAGTPLYMAPEQAAGEPVDPRADLFSLGSVLYEMCTGLAAFRAATTVAVIRRVCDETPRPIREVNPDIPELLCRVIEWLHAKKPADRPASATEVADLLAGMLADLNFGTSRLPEGISVPQNPPRQTRPGRHKWLWAAAALALLSAGLSLGEATGVTNMRGTVVHLPSPEGTLVVEVDDPGVSVAVDGADVVVTGTGVKDIRLKPGSYKVRASKGGKLVRQELVTVTRNGRRVVRISKQPRRITKKPRRLTEAERWEKSVAALPADQQVEAVTQRLKDRNPRFIGPVEPTIRDGVVTGLRFKTDIVSDISPVRALRQLESLECYGTPPEAGKVIDLSPLRGLLLSWLIVSDNHLVDLSPLRGMPLRGLSIARNYGVKDLNALKGLPLEFLDTSHTNVSDLSPLKGMKLTVLWCDQSLVSDLAPLRGMPLRELRIPFTRVSDLTPLRRMPLELLSLIDTPVTDLSPLKGMALRHLELRTANHCDLSPLRGMPLSRLWLSFQPEQDAEIVRSLKTLHSINGKPAADFWKEVDGQ